MPNNTFPPFWNLKFRAITMLLVVILIGGCNSQISSIYKTDTATVSPSSASQSATPTSQVKTQKSPAVATKPVASTVKATGPISTLHAIVMVDTNDPQIGGMISVDLKKMRSYLQKMATLSGLELSTKEFTSEQFRARNVEVHIQSIDVGNDDVLFFYYSGHGFRYQNQKVIWPYFDMQEPVSFDKIISTLRAKTPRLLVALTDACNKVLDGASEPQMAFRSGVTGSRGYRTLFRKFKGEILATSSSPGEYSQTTNYGSWFTRDFLMGLDSETASKNPDWHDLMAAAGKKKSETYSGVNYFQTPHTVVNVQPIAIN
jgi:hypothetical protein